MSRPTIQVAKPNRSLIGLDVKDFALNTNYLLPKIYMQVTVTEDTILPNLLGYPHGAWAFRRLNQYSYYDKNAPEPASIWDPYNYADGDIYDNLFTGEEYTYFSVTSMGSITKGVTVSEDQITMNMMEYVDDDSVTRNDTSLSAMLFAESLLPTSQQIVLPTRPHISVGIEGQDLSETNISEQRMNSKLDTLKIFKTGLLELDLPAEVLAYKADSVVHSTFVEHDLGYPPAYFPPATINMKTVGNLNENAGTATTGFTSDFETTDVYVDSNKLYLRCIRCSNGDDAFGNGGGDKNFSAKTVSLYYTLFYNDISEQFNLLA